LVALGQITSTDVEPLVVKLAWKAWGQATAIFLLRVYVSRNRVISVDESI
jgi:hypothetical protein